MKNTLKTDDRFAKAWAKIGKRFKKAIENDRQMQTGILLCSSPSNQLHWKMAFNRHNSVFTHEDQQFHFASVGKMLTSTMVVMLYEKKLLGFDDYISAYLENDILQGLHVFKGVDYSGIIKVRHLLNHSSGLPDYFTGKTKEGTCMQDLMLTQPDRLWLPLETINWSKKYLQPKFIPGKGFKYSDGNYQLLGLIIEKLSGMKLHEAFQKYIFNPLGMKHTYMPFFTGEAAKNQYPPVVFNHKGINLMNASSVSMSWGGGGIVSNTEDMLKFFVAFNNNTLITGPARQKMNDFSKMSFNIRYGYGLMNFWFPGLSKKFSIWGHSGSTGAFMYYNSFMDVYLIGSFNKLDCYVKPVIFIVKSLRTINKAIRSGK